MAYRLSRWRAGGGQLAVMGEGWGREGAYFSGWGAVDKGRHSGDVSRGHRDGR